MFLFAGPCQLESRDHAMFMVDAILEQIDGLPITFYFKTSYDKANRTSLNSPRGIGISEAMKVFYDLKYVRKIKVLTDVHSTNEVGAIYHYVDMLQIPALLSRQTDLIVAAGQRNLPVNIKKGQFMAPDDIKFAAEKVGHKDFFLTERGTTFGYNNLVVDMRSLVMMKQYGRVIFDATHSVQLPGAGNGKSSGQRQFVAPLARAAAAVGVDGFFIETHQDPDNAPSDGPNMIPVNDLRPLLETLLEIGDKVV